MSADEEDAALQCGVDLAARLAGRADRKRGGEAGGRVVLVVSSDADVSASSAVTKLSMLVGGEWRVTGAGGWAGWEGVSGVEWRVLPYAGRASTEACSAGVATLLVREKATARQTDRQTDTDKQTVGVCACLCVCM